MRLILDTYSGLPDPFVDIPTTLALPLLGVFGDNGMFVGGSAREMPNRLGYRGIKLVLPPLLAGRFGLTRYVNFPALNPISHLRLLIDLHDVIKGAVVAGLSVLDWILKRIKAIISWLSTPAPKGAGTGSPITACKYETLPYDPALLSAFFQKR